jgi:hypothetical protein
MFLRRNKHIFFHFSIFSSLSLSLLFPYPPYIMYRLSKLPLEVLYAIFDFLEFKDLITVGRLNTWYSYKVSTTITERVFENIKQDGWRVHVIYHNTRKHS